MAIILMYHPSYVHGDSLSLVGFTDIDFMDLETWVLPQKKMEKFLFALVF